MKYWDTISKSWVCEGEPTPFTPSKLAPVLKLDTWAKLVIGYESRLDAIAEYFYPGKIPECRMPEKFYRFEMVVEDGKGWVPV